MLMELSAFDVKKVQAKNEAFFERIMDTMKSKAHSLLHNHSLPDPIVANEGISQLTHSLNDVVLESNRCQKSIDKLESEVQHETDNNVFICNSTHPLPAQIVPQTISVPDPERF